MNINAIFAENIAPIRRFEAEGLSDIVVIGGQNGVGKTRLIQHILNAFRSPSSGNPVRLKIRATSPEERTEFGADFLDTANDADCEILRGHLQKNTRRVRLRGRVINFESDRSIQQVQPYRFEWDIQDPDEEEIAWDVSFGGLRNRWQDTQHAIFKKVEARRRRMADRGEQILREGGTSLDLSRYSDPLKSFREAFSMLLSPKTLLDAQPKRQDLVYEFEGQEHPISTLSSGEKEVVNIVFDFIMRSPSDCVVFFDEPEIHLHPELSYKLIQTLRAVGERNQFIFCTHSADIITSSLENSVIFISPPNGDQNQAMMAASDDETHLTLRLLGQSIGIISLGKKIVLIEGDNSSLDKQTYGAILKDRFPELVLVPSEGRELITSFASVLERVLSKTLWGVEFFMLCDRDTIPAARLPETLEAKADGKLKTLGRYHLENYFLDGHVWWQVFNEMAPEEEWLKSANSIEERLREFARELVSYATALIVSAEVRDEIGNVSLMPRDVHGIDMGQLKRKIVERMEKESCRVNRFLSKDYVIDRTEKTYLKLLESLDSDGAEWKTLIPARPICTEMVIT